MPHVFWGVIARLYKNILYVRAMRISPLALWSTPFIGMAAECGLEPDMEKHFSLVVQFFSSCACDADERNQP